MNDIAQLSIRVDSLEAKTAKDDLDKLGQAGRGAAASTEALEKSFDRLMAVLGPAALAYAIKVAVSGAISLQDQYVRLSEVAGTTASAISSLDLPARLSGTSLDSVAMAVARLSKAIGDAQLGDVEKGGMLRAMGINPNDGKDAVQQFEILSKSVSNMKDQNVAGAASMVLINRSFAEMRPLMKEIAEQGTLVATRTNEQAAAAKALEDSWTRLGFQAQQTRFALADGMLPSLQQIANALLSVERNSDLAREAGEAMGKGLLVVAEIAIRAGSAVALTGEYIGGLAAIASALVAKDGKQAMEIANALDGRVEELGRKTEGLLAKLRDAAKAAGGGGAKSGDGMDEEAVAGVVAEARVRRLMEDKKFYEARVNSAKAFGEQYSDAIKTSNILAQEAVKQGIASEETALQQIGANEDARLRVLAQSIERQAALHKQQGNITKQREAADQLAQVNAAIVSNEVITQARITSLREASSIAWKQQLAQRLADVQQTFLTEEQILEDAFTQRQTVIDLAAQQGFIDDDNWQRLSAQNYARWENEKTKIVDEETKKRWGISQVYRQMDLSAASTFFGYMGLLMKTKSKELFEIGKVGAIAETTINTYRAAMGAYAALSGIAVIGPALGVAAAGAAIAYGLSQVQAISSQSYGSGAAGGAVGSFPASPVTGLPTADAGQQAAQGGQSANTTIVHLHGETFGAQQIRDLMERINENTRNGGRVLVV